MGEDVQGPGGSYMEVRFSLLAAELSQAQAKDLATCLLKVCLERIVPIRKID